MRVKATVVAEAGASATQRLPAGPSDLSGRWASPAAAVSVACVALLVGGLQKLSCVAAPQTACYSDVYSLWSARHLAQHVMPYVHGGIQGSSFIGHELEYPVLTGLFVWLCSLPAHSLGGFMVVTIVALAPFGAATAWMLSRMTGRRAMFFAAAPSLVWYSSLNWDLLGTAAAVGAVFAWSRDRHRLAGGLLAIGACFKLWPGYLLLPLAADLLCRRRYRDAAASLGWAAAVALLVNGPFALVNYRGWLAPMVFQSLRPADINANSLWSVVAPSVHRVGTVNDLAAAASGISFAAVIGAGLVRFRREGAFPFVQVSAAMVALFVALGKVHSPQYALWVLPFFALLRIRTGWWVLFLASDVWLFAQFSAYSAVRVRSEHTAVVLADAVLVLLAWVALRSRSAISPMPCGPSEPSWPATPAGPWSPLPRS